METFQEKDSIDVQASTQRRLRLPATSALAFALNLVSYLSSHGPFKIVMIDLLRSRLWFKSWPNMKKFWLFFRFRPDVIDQEGFSQLLFYFLDIFNYVSSERSHQLCQEHIVVCIDKKLARHPSKNCLKSFYLEYFAIVVRRRYRIDAVRKIHDVRTSFVFDARTSTIETHLRSTIESYRLSGTILRYRFTVVKNFRHALRTRLRPLSY